MAEIILPTMGRPVIDRCRICTMPFFAGESQSRIARHVVQCVRANHDRLMAERRQRFPDIMKPWDPEYAAWIQDPAKLWGLMNGTIKP